VCVCVCAMERVLCEVAAEVLFFGVRELRT